MRWLAELPGCTKPTGSQPRRLRLTRTAVAILALDKLERLSAGPVGDTATRAAKIDRSVGFEHNQSRGFDR